MERVILLERSRVPLFLRHRRGNFTKPKARGQKIKTYRQKSSLYNRGRHSNKEYGRQGSEKHGNKPYGGKTSNKRCSGQTSKRFRKVAEPKHGNCRSEPLRRWNTGKKLSRQTIILGRK